MKKSISERKTEKDMDRSERESTTSTPRWVKVTGIIAIVLILLVIMIMLFSGGEHGPGRHLKFNNASVQTPPPIEHGVQQL